MSIQSNIQEIKGEIADRPVKLIAVSKLFPYQSVLEAIEAGHYIFGENYVQEAKSKFETISTFIEDFNKLELHLIGPLQSNKAKFAVRMFDFIHTVDSLKLAEVISKEAKKINKIQKLLVQVNISEEPQKSGVAPDNLKDLVVSILPLSNIQITGLMCIGRDIDIESQSQIRREEFIRLRGMQEELNQDLGLRLDQLSFGMSDDYLIAIEEGSTMVRIGSAIFGERKKV